MKLITYLAEHHKLVLFDFVDLKVDKVKLPESNGKFKLNKRSRKSL